MRSFLGIVLHDQNVHFVTAACDVWGSAATVQSRPPIRCTWCVPSGTGTAQREEGMVLDPWGL